MLPTWHRESGVNQDDWVGLLVPGKSFPRQPDPLSGVPAAEGLRVLCKEFWWSGVKGIDISHEQRMLYR